MRHDPAAGQMLDVLAELYLHTFPQRLDLERLVQRARIGAAADEVKSALTSLKQAGQDIRDGIESSDACSQLENRDFAGG